MFFTFWSSASNKTNYKLIFYASATFNSNYLNGEWDSIKVYMFSSLADFVKHSDKSIA